MEPIAFEVALRFGSDFADIFAVKDYDFALGDPDEADPAASRGRAELRRREQPVPLRRSGQRRPDAGDPVRARRRGRLDDSLADRARAAGGVERPRRRPRRPRGRRRGAARGRAPLRRGARARARVADRVEAARAAAPDELGRPPALVLALGGRPGLVADPQRPRLAAGGRDAVVHDRLRPRHADHVPADPALRAGARAQRARGARQPAGDRGQPGAGCRAGQDRPRGPAREGGDAGGSVPTTGRWTRRRST